MFSHEMKKEMTISNNDCIAQVLLGKGEARIAVDLGTTISDGSSDVGRYKCMKSMQLQKMFGQNKLIEMQTEEVRDQMIIWREMKCKNTSNGAAQPREIHSKKRNVTFG